MTELKPLLEQIPVDKDRTPDQVNQDVLRAIDEARYDIAVIDHDKPWGGGFTRLADSNADRFIGEFFEGLTPEQARLGKPNVPISPKIIVVGPGQRLSWQYHHYRAERWYYITAGGFLKSLTDEQGELQQAAAGDVVQFAQSERHRLVGSMGHYTLVAEIWQHVDLDHLSEEEDIVRLADDYRR